MKTAAAQCAAAAFLHPLRRFDADEVKAGFDDRLRGVCQGHAGGCLGGFAVQDPVLVVVLVVGLGDIRHRPGDHAGLILGGGFADHVREAGEKPEQRLGFVIREGGPVRFRLLQGFRLAQQAAAAGMGILDIGAGLAVEVQGALPGEVDVLEVWSMASEMKLAGKLASKISLFSKG